MKIFKIPYFKGQWDIMGLFPIFLLSGVSHGMVELIRRIIPQSICGDSDFKLRKMDSLVHAFHEVIGTVGALFSVFLILIMGSIFANCYVPLIWILSAIVWKKMLLDKPKLSPENERYEPKQECLLVAIFHFFQGFFISIYHGGRIIFSNNRFLWLILGYAFPLVMHRYLESQLAPAFSKHILKITPYSQIMVGGINLGELTGAVFVVRLHFNKYNFNLVLIQLFCPYPSSLGQMECDNIEFPLDFALLLPNRDARLRLADGLDVFPHLFWLGCGRCFPLCLHPIFPKQLPV